MNEPANREYREGTDDPCYYDNDEQLLMHDWRLTAVEVLDNGDYRRRWYCTRCRLIEEWISA